MIRHDITVMTDWALKFNSHPLPASCQWKHTHMVPAGERRRGGGGGGGGENDTYIEDFYFIFKYV